MVNRNRRRRSGRSEENGWVVAEWWNHLRCRCRNLPRCCCYCWCSFPTKGMWTTRTSSSNRTLLRRTKWLGDPPTTLATKKDVKVTGMVKIIRILAAHALYYICNTFYLFFFGVFTFDQSWEQFNHQEFLLLFLTTFISVSPTAYTGLSPWVSLMSCP